MGMENLLLVGGGGALAYFFFKDSSTPEEVALKSDASVQNSIDYAADASRAMENAENTGSNVNDAAKQLADAIEKLKSNLIELIKRRRSCSRCACEIHLKSLNEAYAALLAMKACLDYSLGAGYRSKKAELERYIAMQNTATNITLNSDINNTNVRQFLENMFDQAYNTGMDMVNGAADFLESQQQAFEDLKDEAVSNANELLEYGQEASAEYITSTGTSMGNAVGKLNLPKFSI